MAFLSAPDQGSSLEIFAKENGVGLKALKNTMGGFLFFLTECVKKNMSSAHVKEDLINLGLKSSHSIIVSSIWQERYSSLSLSMIQKTLTVNELVDMEWKFGVTASSSELNQVGTCFLQIKLVIDRGNNKLENVLMELSLPQFYQFLQQMQTASRHCTNLSS